METGGHYLLQVVFWRHHQWQGTLTYEPPRGGVLRRTSRGVSFNLRESQGNYLTNRFCKTRSLVSSKMTLSRQTEKGQDTLAETKEIADSDA